VGRVGGKRFASGAEIDSRERLQRDRFGQWLLPATFLAILAWIAVSDTTARTAYRTKLTTLITSSSVAATVRSIDRRRFLALTTSAAVATTAGCSLLASSPPADEEAKAAADVVVGPDGSMRFEPQAITVSAGETVTWYFATSNHNVACQPGEGEHERHPDGADPFASFDAGEPRTSTVPRGETFEHAFEVPGEYEYVCVPHVSLNMFGTVTVGA